MKLKALCGGLNLFLAFVFVVDCSYTQASEHKFYRKSWAVVIGINQYEKWPGLEYAVNDARSVKKQLEKRGFEVTYLEDDQATRENITQLLWDELPEKLQWDDRAVIFFSGHGDTEDLNELTKMGYIIPVDATPGVRSTAIPMEWIRQLSQKLKAKHVFYVFDACYSGLGLSSSKSLSLSKDIDSSEKTGDVSVNRSFLEKITQARAVQMVTAGGQGEEVVEESGHGLFTRYFLEALDGAADQFPKDGVVTSNELGMYLRPTVSIASNNRQTPLYGTLEGEGEIVFVLPEPILPPDQTPIIPSTPAPTATEDLLQKPLKNLMKKLQDYERLIQEKRQGADVEAQLFRVLVNIVNESKNIEKILEQLPPTPQITHRIHQIQDLIQKYEKELSDRYSQK